ncbi:Ig-like domain-containing protein [Pseudoxanthomonas beigongshangi]
MDTRALSTSKTVIPARASLQRATCGAAVLLGWLLAAGGVSAQTYPANLGNTATVTLPPTVTDPQPGNNSSTDTNALAAEAALTLDKTLLTASPVVTGGTVTYRITLTNAGPSAALGAALTDTVPAELGNVGWTCAASGGSSCGAASGTGNVALVVNLMPAGTITVDVTGTAPPTTPSTIGANTATVAPPPGTTDPDPADNTDTTPPVPVAARPIVAVADSAGPVNGIAGQANVVNVLANDTLGGAPVVPAQITFTPISTAQLIVNADGSVDVPAGTANGTYTTSYQICETANPANCDTAAITVTVNSAATIDAVDDPLPPQAAGSITLTANVLANDTLTGAPVIPALVTLTSTPSGPLTIAGDGAVTLDPVATPGTYSATYEICEIAVPTNCDTATASVRVLAAINAVDDAAGPVNGSTGAASLLNVLSNDSAGGVTPAALATVSLAGGGTAAIVFNADGTVSVPAGTAAGTHVANYTICYLDAPTVCDSATVQITVVAPGALVANDDAYSGINGTPGDASAGNVLDNDTLNGAPVAPGDIVLTPTNAGPVTIAADGTVSVAPNTPAGVYTPSYQICEAAVPDNCDTATVNVTVSTIDAVTDALGPAPAGTSAGNVLTNDFVDGAPATPGAVTLTQTSGGPVLTIAPDGTVTIAPGTPAGPVSGGYEICQVAQPTLCDSVTITVTVAAGTLIAVDDALGPVNGGTGGAAGGNVLDNDTLNGAPVTAPQVTVAPANVAPITLGTDGTVSVAAGTAAGSYTASYDLCEAINPANCDTATVTVAVTTLDAVDDTLGPVNGGIGGSAGNVLTNDRLDGAPFTTTAVTLTPANTPQLTIGADGSVTVTAGTAAGTYAASYQICQVAQPAICDTAAISVNVIVDAALNAVDDGFGPIDGAAGSANAGNVLANDTFNGVPVTLATVVFTPNAGAPLAIDANGVVSVPAGTPAGIYSASYQICEAGNLSNCDSAQVTVTVQVLAAIDAIDDGPYVVNGTTGNASVANLLANDTFNGGAVAAGSVSLTSTAAAPLAVDANGVLSVAPGTPAGPLTANYTICETGNPGNCDTAAISVQVVVVDAQDDGLTLANGASGGVAGNVLGNDIVNGAAASGANAAVNATATAQLSLGANGDVIVATNTPPGSYTLTYTLCALAAPSICDTATVTVTVAAGPLPISAANDSGAAAGRGGGGAIANVLANDRLGGATPTPAEVTLIVTVAPSHPGIALDTASGAVTVVAGTPAGGYTLEYRICQIAAPANCAGATASITVNPAAVDAVDDAAGPVGGLTGATGVVNLLANDTLDGAPTASSDVGFTVLSADAPLTVQGNGQVDVAPGTPAGTYTVTYRLCELLNPANCDQATVTVQVQAAAIDAIDDIAPAPVGSVAGGQAIANVAINDLLNGVAVTPAQVELSQTASTHANVRLQAGDGAVTVLPRTPAGTYTVTYRLCERLNPGNCDTAIASLAVALPAIDAQDDTAPPIPGGVAATGVLDVLANDQYDGGAATTPAIILAPRVQGPLTLNADGSVDVAAGTPGGSYTLTYTLCDAINPANCDSATVTIVINATAITAVDDAGQTPQGTTLVIPVLANDTYAGAPADANRVLVQNLTTPAHGTVVIGADGGVTYTPTGYFSGDDSFRYDACERAVPDNCATATVAITVLANIVTAVADQASARQAPVVIPVLANDTAEHAPLDPASLSIVVAPVHGQVVCTQGACTYTATPRYVGQDRFEYRVCDVSVPTPVCAQAAVDIDVQAEPVVLRLSKTAARRTARIGDLVRYTLRIDNVGEADAEQVSLFDRLPEGFVLVPESLQVGDDDAAGALSNARPLRIGALDIAAGRSATVIYVLRVGAGVGPGVHTNRAIVRNDENAALSNEATADVEVTGDPMLDDSLIIGSVFHDANANGRQDPGERGLPGVRLGTVEGLLIETDRHGRFHLAGIDGGRWARGRNFLIKVDAATLPPGSRFTTENPRVLRITPGVPVRFDFGVQVPGMPLGGGTGEVEIDLGQVFFATGSADVPAEHAPLFERIAERLREGDGGRVIITAQADELVLAFHRAAAVRAALDARLAPGLRQATAIELRTQVDGRTALVTLDQDIGLGNLLFDTDSATIRPQYQPLLEAIAERIESGPDVTVSIAGHADARGSEEHNLRLSRQRADAVGAALAARLSPTARTRLRVETGPPTPTAARGKGR